MTTEHIGPESRHSHQRLSGAGTPTHLALARYHTGLGIKLNGIHDKGTAPAVTALPSGETHVMFVSHPSVSAPIPSVRLRILAVTIAQPPSELPHLQTAIEAGLPPCLIEARFGEVAPVKADRTALDRIDSETRKVLVLPDVQ